MDDTKTPVVREISLDDRYDLDEGVAFMSGVQALARVPLSQRRTDDRHGRRTSAFISGYPGSPLAGFDRELIRIRSRLAERGIVHRPGLNEDVAATSVWGSQLAAGIPGARFEGVLGMWYAKAPGLDRSGDAMRHANYSGAHPLGGAVVAVGEDPACRSSTVPSITEGTLADLLMPTFVPGNVQEIIELGLHAIACSRMSGTWSGLALATNVVDGAGTVTLHPEQVVPAVPPDWKQAAYQHVPRADLSVPVVLELEGTLFEIRLPLAAAYATHNGVNRVTLRTSDDWIGIVSAGKTYYEVRQALADLGLDEDAISRAGVRLLKLGMVFPLDRQLIQDFAADLDEVLVVEDKLPLIEKSVRDALYGTADAPRVVGKRDEDGHPLLSMRGELDATAIARVVAQRLRRRVTLDSIEARLDALAASAARVAGAAAPTVSRTPFFCSGCPHNSSTVVPDGALVGAGIGCHAMVLLAPEGRGTITGLTQMGGEGAQWIGMAPFTETEHFVQNLGDGTFHHSGSLAVRAAIAAGVNITFKILYNDSAAMTGGQAIKARCPLSG
jgi:indolepyruvate ferredoxin oxidoreductase